MSAAIGRRDWSMATHAFPRTRSFGRAVAAACALGVIVAAQAALADGNVISPARLRQTDRTALVAAIQADKKVHPEAFASVRSISAKASELDARKRGRMAAMGPRFKALGPNALLPMIELVAIDAPPRGGMSDSAWTALRAGLIEAIGSHRDARGRAVFNAILESPEDNYYVVRAAAEALGRLATDDDAARLVTLSRAGGPKHKAILAGMGHCRRTVVAQELARVLGTKPSEEIARAAIGSLGDAGSAWAWKTPSVAEHDGEQSAVRAEAAKALVGAFVAYRGEVRQACSNALMMVDEPSTPSLIAAARAGAPEETVRDLDSLAARFARNPTR